MKTTPPGSDYGLGLERHEWSCGKTTWGHGGGWIGSLSFAATTGGGRHAFAMNLNGDWSTEGMLDVLEAEFCGVEPGTARGTSRGTAPEPARGTARGTAPVPR
ncbi:hypothetical protein JNUCC64_06960 [Streptomyces sp. JNUCC 64]